MYFSTIIREAFKALGRNRIRSVLTMLGIIMGVAAFICVVGVGNAGSSRVEDQLHKVGDNLIWGATARMLGDLLDRIGPVICSNGA